MDDIKNELKKYNSLKVKLRLLYNELEDVKSEGSNIKACYIRERVQDSYISDPTSEGAIHNIDKEKALEGKITRLKLRIKRVEDLLEIVPELERELIKCRYFQKMSWTAICMRFGYCERHLQKKLNIALEDLNEVYQDITRIHNELTIEI